MNKYQRIMRKYKKKSKNKNLNDKLRKTYFDSLYTRFFLSSLLLLSMVLANVVFHIDVHKEKLSAFKERRQKEGAGVSKKDVQKYLNTNINITKIGYTLFSTFIEKEQEVEVSLIDMYDNHSYIKEINYIESSSYNGINNIKSGTVIKIYKENNLYAVTIQTVDNYLITYNNLDTIECNLYQYISLNEIIGTSKYENDRFCFNIQIIKDNIFYNIDSL